MPACSDQSTGRPGFRAFFSIVLLWTKRAGLLKGVHQAAPHSIGALLFPISLSLCAAVYWPLNPLIYQGSALILGLADGMAGLVGQGMGQRAYYITGSKTIEGSLTFFIVTCLILSGLILYYQHSIDLPAFFNIILIALILTLMEGLISGGWDNLPLPLLGGLAIYYLL